VGEVRANVEAAVDSRLQPLCRGSIGRMFRTARSRPSPAELLRWPTVIELQALGPDQASLVNLFLLASLQRHVRQLGPVDTLRNVLVLEEAHNLVPAHARTVAPGAADPQGSASRLLVRLLAEMRAYGLGVLVADQSPSAVAPEVVKSTGVKLSMRTTDREDRECLAGSSLLDADAETELARLRTGEGFLYDEGHYRPVRVAVERRVTAATPGDDLALERLSHEEWFREQCGQRLREDLDRLLASLRRYLSASVKRARMHDLDAAGNAEVRRVVERVRRTLDRRVDMARRGLGAAACNAVATLYSDRLLRLLRTAGDAFVEVGKTGESRQGREKEASDARAGQPEGRRDPQGRGGGKDAGAGRGSRAPHERGQ
jgi:hypothetical protein